MSKLVTSFCRLYKFPQNTYHSTYLYNKKLLQGIPQVSKTRKFSICNNLLLRDIGKEASEALSVSSNRVREATKIQKRNNLRRLKSEEYYGLDLEEEFDLTFLEHFKKNRCQAYCTAEEYNFELLLPSLKKDFKVNMIIDDVYHIQLEAKNNDSNSILNNGEVFLFKGGTFVHWGPSKDSANHFLNQYIRSNQAIEKGRYEEYETEYFDFVQDSSLDTGMLSEYIIIGGKGDALLSKLAFSHGLARSAKLSILEDMLDTLLQSMAHYPLILASGKKLPLTRQEILNKLGQVFLLRGILNLQSESFLDTPDYYWSKPQLETCYELISKNLDVRPRIAILNKKLDYANELTDLLREQLSEAHSNNLELCIIVLIAVEVLFESIRYYERYTNNNNNRK